MIAVWMIYSAWVAGLLAIAGRAAEEFLTVLGYPRRWVWVATVVMALALSFGAPGRIVHGRMVEPAFEEFMVQEVADSRPQGSPENLQIVVPDALAHGSYAVTNPAREGALTRAFAWVGSNRAEVVERSTRTLWLGLSSAMILVLLLALVRSHRERRQWPYAQVLGTWVRVAPREGPAVMGALRPEIVLPRWLLGRPAEEVRLALEHEREHIRAGDRWLLLLGCLATAILPWNPAVWWIQSRLRLAVELDCDRRVIGSGAPPQLYGSLLLDIASRTATGGLRGSVAFAGAPSHLERRIRIMTRNDHGGKVARALVAGGLAVFALIVAFATQVPPAAALDSGTAAELEVGIPDDAVSPSAGAAQRQVISGTVAGASTLPAIQLPLSASEQNGQISGIVRDRVTGSPIAAVQVRLEGTTIGSLSSATGTFSLNDVPAGTYTVIAQRIGYAEARQAGVSVTSGATTPLSLSLNPVVVNLQGVVTTGPIEPVRGVRSPITVGRLAREAVPVSAIQNPREIVATGLVDPVRGVRSPITVARLAREAVPVSAVGSPLLVIDGVVELGMRLTSDIIEMIGTREVESIEILKGEAATRLYGSRGRDGVIIIETRPPETSGVPAPQ
jgi:TonB-dependent SusC/RagA subfamily outer membrane receptor